MKQKKHEKNIPPPPCGYSQPMIDFEHASVLEAVFALLFDGAKTAGEYTPVTEGDSVDEPYGRFFSK